MIGNEFLSRGDRVIVVEKGCFRGHVGKIVSAAGDGERWYVELEEKGVHLFFMDELSLYVGW